MNLDALRIALNKKRASETSLLEQAEFLRIAVNRQRLVISQNKVEPLVSAELIRAAQNGEKARTEYRPTNKGIRAYNSIYNY